MQTRDPENRSDFPDLLFRCALPSKGAFFWKLRTNERQLPRNKAFFWKLLKWINIKYMKKDFSALSFSEKERKTSQPGCGRQTASSESSGHTHPFIYITVQPFRHGLLFSVYDFSECHNFGALRADSLAPGARRSPQNAWSRKPCLRLGSLTALIKIYFDSWRQRTD